MPKHIHIYLSGRRVGKTRDAGFDESKHKRDHGKFTSMTGHTASQHEEKAAYHRNNLGEKGSKHEDSPHHQAAMEHHLAAAQALKEAQRHQENKTTGLAKTKHQEAHKHAAAAYEAEQKFETNRKARESKYIPMKQATKPGPDGKPMGIHPALQAAAAAAAGRTAPARHPNSMIPAAKK